MIKQIFGNAISIFRNAKQRLYIHVSAYVYCQNYIPTLGILYSEREVIKIKE